MSLNPEWNITCRVCLQEGEIRSLFETCPESNMSYCNKVMQCTSVEIRRNDSLPEQICVACIEDLNVAYRFRVNCESSDAILQSYKQTGGGEWDESGGRETSEEESCSGASASEIQIPIGSDVVYSYKPPVGLNVKLVPREQTVLLENNGEIVVCEAGGTKPREVALKREAGEGSPLVDLGPVEGADEDDVDSFITYDDGLAPSMSRAGDLEEDDDERTQERPELISGLTREEEDIHAAEGDNDGAKSQPPDDSSTDIFFNTELVYMDKEEDLLNQLGQIKHENNQDDDWEIIYDDGEDDGSSTVYFQKLQQPNVVKLPVLTPAPEVVPILLTAATSTAAASIPLPPPLKTIQTIRKANVPNEQTPTIENVTTKPGPDGSLETIIRVKRNLRTQQQQQQHVCKLCNSSYKYKHALETHMRRHRGDKPYKCTDCEKAFVVPFELRRHMRTHTGAKPYKCKFCERKFSDFGSKIKHERTHTGERPYVCDVCEKSFTYSHVLTSHMLIHTGVKKYSCSDCGKRFAKAHHLKAHQNTHVRVPSTSALSLFDNNNITDKADDLFDGAEDDCDESKNDASIAALLDRHASGRVVDDDDDDGCLSGALNPTTGSHVVDQLMVDALDNRSTDDFQLEDPESAGGHPFGQLVNISDYMISAVKGEPTSIGAIMDDTADDTDSLLNVVTVLASSNQVGGLVEGDYANIRIING